ncbi:single-stranded DNA-binding protein [Flavivirga aquimarina]|uniref:Single-stranded DNA-binding protein n=1 Tax=Flavivirga aquimarina TaxID=2027862 RepID=A0ABT8WB95_9FLAO|nr:single-stranded DNA-binding protein [Flavivirga aquimarina]MDO5970316.1 single-stranded DNA-binding protein [Flavivirga aquimarina]
MSDALMRLTNSFSKGLLTNRQKGNIMSKKTETQNETNQETKLFADTNVSMKSGRLVKDAELVGKGKFVRLRIATNKQYLDANKEVQTNTNYFNALVSSNLKNAFEAAQDLKKCDWVYLKGEDAKQSFDTLEGYRKAETIIYAYKVGLKNESSSNQTQEA